MEIEHILFPDMEHSGLLRRDQMQDAFMSWICHDADVLVICIATLFKTTKGYIW